MSESPPAAMPPGTPRAAGEPRDGREALLADSPSEPVRLSINQEVCLDLIRILMAQFVVVGHFLHLTKNTSSLSKLPFSALYVSVFFMLSGFLIFSTTWRRRNKGITFRDYMIERSARLGVCLLPALSFAALVAYLTIDLPDYPALHATGPIHFIGNLLMLEDYPLFQILRRLGLESEFFIRPYASAEPYWSLPIEYFCWVVFGYLFFYAYLQRGRPAWPTTFVFLVAAGAVVYHSATGFGQCLSLMYLLGALGPWFVSFDRNLQKRYGYSDRTAMLLILGWLGLFAVLLGLRGISRGLDFYEFQVALFIASVLMGLIWLTGRIARESPRWFSSAARLMANQTYAVYLTHNATLTYYIANTGRDFTLGEALFLMLGCNLVAAPFYFLFDRHHKAVAQWLKSLQWFRLPVRLRRQSVG